MRVTANVTGGAAPAAQLTRTSSDLRVAEVAQIRDDTGRQDGDDAGLGAADRSPLTGPSPSQPEKKVNNHAGRRRRTRVNAWQSPR
jgi:hypothetical protein